MRAHGRHNRLAKLADELGITEEQRKALMGSARGAIETAFPDRKAHRLEKEARVKAISTAFRSDDFDAHSFNLGKDVDGMFKSASEVTHTMANVAAAVLTADQRAGAARALRARAPQP